MSDETADVDGGEVEPAGKAPVPYERFAALAAERRELKGKVAELDAMRSQLAEFGKRAADAEAALTAGRAEWEERTALYRAGIDDDDGIDVARTLYARQPAEARKSMAEWIAEMKADGATVPKPLAPYLTAQTAPPPKTQPKAAPASGQAPSAAGRVDDAAVRAAREAGKRTGDWSEFKRLVGMS